jgi:hypothetical protein
MDKRLATIKTALRVLKAITVKCDPSHADVEDLREFSPLLANAPLDELACGVIRQMIKLTCDDISLQ